MKKHIKIPPYYIRYTKDALYRSTKASNKEMGGEEQREGKRIPEVLLQLSWR
jgi:hypothetical protein